MIEEQQVISIEPQSRPPTRPPVSTQHPALSTPPAAHAEGLTRHYRRGAEAVRALDGVDLTIERGEFAAIVGPSGSGKSTLMNLLGCMDRPSAGRLWIAGEEVAGLGDAGLTRMRRAHIGFIFQQFHLLPTLTVLENVLLPASFGQGSPGSFAGKRERAKARKGPTLKKESREPGRDAPLPGFLDSLSVVRTFALSPFRASLQKGRASICGQPTAAPKERARDLLERVGLGGRLNHRPSQLSGGEMQRVAVARALINDPELLLADEPTGNLDTEASAVVLDIFRNLNASGLTVVLVTHNPELAARTSRLIRLRDGRIVEDARL